MLGALAFSQMKYALFPDITFPVVVVNARAPIIDAGAMESQVTIPLEHELLKVDGVSDVRSSTYPGFSSLQVVFQFGRSVDRSKADVELGVRRSLIPPYALPTIDAVNLNESVVASYTLSSPAKSFAELTQIASAVVAPAFRTIDGVLSVNVIGGLDSTGHRSALVRYNGQDAVAVQVVKTAQANTLDVAAALDDRAAALAPKVSGINFDRAATQAPYIREASRSTTETLAMAVALSVLVIYPFLHSWRATLISALTIPTSLLGTVLVMYLLHFNFETITLLALALVVGVIVDDSIVAVENIVRHIEGGEAPREAALRANREIGRTLVAASLTIVAVFLPIGLMGGTLGQFFKPFGLTASAAVLFSLLSARSLCPALAATLMSRPGVKRRWAQTRYPRYRAILSWALGHRRWVIGIALAAFAIGLGIIPFIPKGFIPHLDRGEFQVSFTLQAESTLSDGAAVASRLETVLRRDPAIDSVFTTYDIREPGQGTMDVRLHPDRDMTTIEVENRVRDELPATPGATVSVDDLPFIDNGAAKPLEVALLGDDLTLLRRTGLQIASWMRSRADDFVDVTTTGIAKVHGVERIDRLDGKRTVGISADLPQGIRIGDATDLAVKEARQVAPAGVTVNLGGVSADAARTFGSFTLTLVLSIVAIITVLYLLFRNLADPFVISVSLPLSIVGALFALWVTHSEFGMISMMGIIFLFGLVNKNAILLVDAIKRLRSSGLSRVEAILDAGSLRLRPIMMTTSALMLAMLPIALGFGAGAELRAPMAVAIIGGLSTSTLLSLIVVPVAYSLVDDLRSRRRLKVVRVKGAAAS